MGYNSQLTRQRVLDSAKKEFLEVGYQKASMRNIALMAEVTTGAMYNHFKNKEQIFDALVQEPAEAMVLESKRILEVAINSLDDNNLDSISDQSRSGTDWMLSFIYENIEAFRLIFCCSEGTRWESYLDELIKTEESYYRRYFDHFGNDGKHIEDIFLHITVSSSFQYLVEIVSHDLPYEQAVSVMDKVQEYCLAGWTKVLM